MPAEVPRHHLFTNSEFCPNRSSSHSSHTESIRCIDFIADYIPHLHQYTPTETHWVGERFDVTRQKNAAMAGEREAFPCLSASEP
jgi:hypothetical protein